MFCAQLRRNSYPAVMLGVLCKARDALVSLTEAGYVQENRRQGKVVSKEIILYICHVF